MNLQKILAEAQNGQIYSQVAAAFGLDPGETRTAMEGMCPAIVLRLREEAAQNEALLEALAGVLDEGYAGSPLDEPGVLTGGESLSDGQDILQALYRSREAALAELEALAPGVPARQLSDLAAVSATAAVSAIVRAQGVMPVSGVQTAMGGSGGLMSIIVGALVRGVVQAAKRELTSRARKALAPARPTRRKATPKRKATRSGTAKKASSRTATRKTAPRKTSARKTPARKSSTRRRSTISIEDIFGDLLGNKTR